MLAMYWQYFYGIKNKLKLFLSNHKIISIGLIIGMLIILNIAIYPSVYGYVKPYFEINDRMSSLQSLFLGLGGALTGATAIAFSLIMFAMQVNVERLPYGLFKKFSTDFKLLGLFIIIMLLAISISSMSLIQDATWSTKFICIAFWNISIIILLTLTAYKRALTLISPFEQLAILVSHTKKNLTLWSKAANRAVPLLRKSNVEDKEDTFATPNHDIEKAFYLNSLNPYWTIKALQAIEYCTAIARYHAVQGDYEISQAAIDSIVIINGHYIIAKRKTFYVDPPFFPTPLSHDAFISRTLENFRKNAHIAIVRGDEQQIIQYLNGFEKLCCQYLTIDYSSDNPTKSHSNLAASYLVGVIESTIPSKLIEVTMEGLRTLGRVARLIAQYGNENDICTISEKISIFSAAHATNEKFWPAAQAGTNELALLTLSLLKNNNLSNYAINKLNDDVRFVAEITINKSEVAGSQICSSILAPYYSVTDPNSLQSKLAELCNAVLKTERDHKDAIKIIKHIAIWGSNLSQIQKNLFLLALSKESHFVFDIIHWIANITEIFLALSNAEACEEYYKTELQNNAKKLICVLSFCPDDANTIKLLENYQFTDILFGAAVSAKHRGCIDIALKIREIILFWLSKSIQSSISRTIFENVCYALACLDMILEINNDLLINDIQKILIREVSIGDKNRTIIAQNIESRLNHHYSRNYSSSKIESALYHADKERLETTLSKLINIIRPSDS